MSDRYKQTTAHGSLASTLAGPLRLVAWVLWGIAALFLAAIAAIAWTQPDADLPWGAWLAPLFPGALGIGVSLAARMLASGTGPEMPVVASWMFGGFGVLIMIVGVAIVFDDPGGFAAMAFGAVFVGVGWLVRKVFATPPGKKAVTVAHEHFQASRASGGHATYTRSARIFVDEDAGPEQVEGMRRQWLDEQWQQRPDWAAGRVEDEHAREGDVLAIGTGIALAVATVATAVAWFTQDFFWWWVAVPSIGMTLVLGWMALRRHLHERKFLPSHFVMRETPARPGSRLQGEVETGVPREMALPDGFHLTLECVHRWEESTSSSSGSNHRSSMRREVLWEREAQADGRPMFGLPARWAVAVDFELPSDKPATTLGSSRLGISWELEVHAPLPGLDYRARFKVPVLPVEASAAG